MKLSEKEVKRQVLDALKKEFGYNFKYYHNLGGLGSKPGRSDVSGCLFGKYLALEFKKEGWKPPTDPVIIYKKTGKFPEKTTAWDHYQKQLKEINEVKAAGGLAGFCQSLEEAEKILGVKTRLF